MMILDVGQRDRRLHDKKKVDGEGEVVVVIELIGEKFKPLKQQLSAQPSILNRNNGNYFHIAGSGARTKEKNSIKGYSFLLSAARNHPPAFIAKSVCGRLLCIDATGNLRTKTPSGY